MIVYDIFLYVPRVIKDYKYQCIHINEFMCTNLL